MRNRVIITVLILLSILCSSCSQKNVNAELTADTVLFTSNTGIQQVVMTCEVEASFIRKVELYDENNNLIGEFEKVSDGIYEYNLEFDTTLLDTEKVNADFYYSAKIYMPLSDKICDEWIRVTYINKDDSPDKFDTLYFQRILFNYLYNINYNDDSVEVRNEKLNIILNEAKAKGLIKEFYIGDDSFSYTSKQNFDFYTDLSEKHTAGCN